MKITNCQVNHLTDPLGYKLDKPVFHWIVEEALGKRQTAARIVVESAGEVIKDTGWGKLNPLATSLDLTLKPCTAYTWTVAVRTEADEEAVSAINRFETGKMDEHWTGKWIGCDDGEPRHPVFFRDIVPAKQVASARLYICGLGLYEAYWDEKKIGSEYLTPYCNNYDAWVQAQTYDVTEEVKGPGRLSIMLGNGWYKGRFSFIAQEGGIYGNEWKLIAELHLTYADGTKEVIGTDENWLVKRSRLTDSGIYDGEQRDDTLADTAAVPAVRVSAPKGKLTDRLSLPVVLQKEFPVRDILHTPAGETVLDIGQNISGLFRMRVSALRGAVVRLQFGEILDDGNFYRGNLRTARQEYVYVSGGEETVLEPKFTFYGYQYVKVEGIKNLKKEDFTGLAISSDLPEAGRLCTGSALVNRLIENAKWSQLDNFVDVPTDCPQRDERMGWTGDAQVFAPTASFMRDCYAFYNKYLYDMRTEQAEHDGAVPNVVPDFNIPNTSSAWGDATCIIPWVVYRYTGDRRILEDHYPGMKAWVDYMERKDGADNGWRREHHFGDWLALDGYGLTSSCRGATDEGLIADVHFRYSALLTARVAELLGEKEDAARYEKLAARILEDTRREYFSATGRLCMDTQTGYLMTLKYGLSTDRARNEAALVDLLERSRRAGTMLRTGFVGTPLLCEQLSEIGRSDLAYDLLLNEDYPGWLYEVRLGATTIWERWNGKLPDGRLFEPSMNSYNHYAYGAVVEWIYAYAAGLSQVENGVGFKHLVIRPQVDERLGSVEAEYASASGLWKSAWKAENGEIEVSVTVPFDCTAELVLPYAGAEVFTDRTNPMFTQASDGVCLLESGSYRVRYTMNLSA